MPEQPGIITQEGEVCFAQAIYDGWNVSMNWQVGLYQNAVTPHYAMVFAELVEADYPGYTRFTVDNIPFGFGGNYHIGFRVHGVDLVFTGTAPTSAGRLIYGWFMVSDFPFADALMIVRPFQSPKDAPSLAGDLSVDAIWAMNAYNGPVIPP